MTPHDLDTTLSAFPPDAALIFDTTAGPIGSGYHVTEWKLARVESIDCGAQQSSWTEASLQLLDGDGGRHMTVGTFRGILRKSIAALPELGQTPFKVEFAPGNAGLRTFEAERPSARADGIHISLIDSSAACKPMQTWAAAQSRDHPAPTANCCC